MREDLKRLLKRYREINDFYIFGSFVKGKYKPADIDVAVITNKKDFDLLKKIIKDMKEYPNLHIELVLLNEIFTEPIWKSLLSEGFSVRKNKYIRDLMRIESMMLYNYNLRALNHSEKTLFNRAFKAELKITSGMPVSRGAVMIPISKTNEFEAFLSRWEKAKIKKWRVLIL